jgi:hypothetical protein
MGSRLSLHTVLKSILTNVYFQPPPSLTMSYPCIVYERSNIDTKFADNNPYSLETRYMVTVIDPNPDSTSPMKIAALPKCNFDRHFTADNLNHDVFSLYY